MSQQMFFGYYFGKLSIATTDGERPEKGDWSTIDESTLSNIQQGLLAEYRAAYKMAKEAKAVFEASVRRDAGFTVAAKPVKVAAKTSVSLADFIAAQKANGGSL